MMRDGWDGPYGPWDITAFDEELLEEYLPIITYPEQNFLNYEEYMKKKMECTQCDQEIGKQPFVLIDRKTKFTQSLKEVVKSGEDQLLALCG